MKLADRITNLGPPPQHWGREQRIAYALEAQLILERLGASSDWLARRLQQCIADYQHYCN